MLPPKLEEFVASFGPDVAAKLPVTPGRVCAASALTTMVGRCGELSGRFLLSDNLAAVRDFADREDFFPAGFEKGSSRFGGKIWFSN